MYVVKHDGFSVAGGLGQAHIPRDNGGEDLCAEEASEVGGYLAGKGCTLIIHGEKDAFDCQSWIEGTADAH